MARQPHVAPSRRSGRVAPIVILTLIVFVVTVAIAYFSSYYSTTSNASITSRGNIFEGDGGEYLILLYRPDGSILMEETVEHWSANAAGIEFLSIDGKKSIVTNVRYVVVQQHLR